MTESVFDVIGDDARRALMPSTRRHKYKRGETIFHEGDLGDSLHVIDKGAVAIRASTPLGDVATFTVLVAGDTFGEGALLSADSRRSASAVPLEATETRSLHRDEYERLRADYPAVERLLVQALAEQVQRLSRHLVEALYHDVDTRLFRRLSSLADAFGERPIPLTQDDLASLAGTTRPTANRTLKAAEDAGILALSRGHITILDPDALARRAR